MIVLASASPRRRELLSEWGYDFRIVDAPIDEFLPEGTHPETGVQDLARRKALSGLEAWRAQGGSAEDLVLGADTIVVLADRIFGKPADESDASKMLHALSGNTHRVMTAVALAAMTDHPPQIEVETDVAITEVTFRELTSREIAEYIATGEPMDKAAAYGIQGGASKFVIQVCGSLTNVIGLPQELLTKKLENRGIFPKK